jgi:phosphoribosyl-ATP pyrophosphohydrolase
MTDKLIPPADMDVLVQKVWGEAQAKIEESVGYSIRHELTLRAQTITRRHMDALLAPLIEKVIEERKEFIVAALNKRAEEVVEKALDRFDSAFKYTLQQSLSSAVQDPMHQLGNQLSNLMWKIVEEVVDVRTKENQRKREEAHFQRLQKAEAKDKETREGS